MRIKNKNRKCKNNNDEADMQKNEVMRICMSKFFFKNCNFS